MDSSAAELPFGVAQAELYDEPTIVYSSDSPTVTTYPIALALSFEEATVVPLSSPDTEAPPEAAVLSIEEPTAYSTQPNNPSVPFDTNEIYTPDPWTQLDIESKNCSIFRNKHCLMGAFLSIVVLAVVLSLTINPHKSTDVPYYIYRMPSDYVNSWNVLELGIMPSQNGPTFWATDPKDCVQRCVSENSQNQAIVWLNVSKLRTFINIGNCFCQNTSTCVYNSSYDVPGIAMSIKPLPRKCNSYEIQGDYNFSGTKPDTFEGRVQKFDEHYAYISYPTLDENDYYYYYSGGRLFGNLSSSDFAFLQAYDLSQFKVSTTVVAIPNSNDDVYYNYGLTLNVSLSVEVPGVEVVIELTSFDEDPNYPLPVSAPIDFTTSAPIGYTISPIAQPVIQPADQPVYAPNSAPIGFTPSAPIGYPISPIAQPIIPPADQPVYAQPVYLSPSYYDLEYNFTWNILEDGILPTTEYYTGNFSADPVECLASCSSSNFGYVEAIVFFTYINGDGFNCICHSSAICVKNYTGVPGLVRSNKPMPGPCDSTFP